MNQSLTNIFCFILIAVTANLTAVSAGLGEVVVFDGVTTVQTPTRIKVLTKGLIFAKGGRLVDIYLDDQLLKRILTGADGYGFLKYIPTEPGFKNISARSGTTASSGLILVMRKNEKAVVIDVEGAFKDAIFSETLRANSRKALRALSKDYTLIYLSRIVGKGISRSWLEKEDFPESVILRWQGPDTFKSLIKRGVNLYALIGSADVMSAAKPHVALRYTFEQSRDAKRVEDWDEILNLLQPPPSTDSLQKESR